MQVLFFRRLFLKHYLNRQNVIYGLIKNLSIDDIKHQLETTLWPNTWALSGQRLGENFLKATMPVDHRTKQPYGLLHGGASCVLAETIGSVASAMVIDHSKFYCVGLEINANHVQ